MSNGGLASACHSLGSILGSCTFIQCCLLSSAQQMRLLKWLEYFFFVVTLDFSRNVRFLLLLVNKDRHKYVHYTCFASCCLIKMLLQCDKYICKSCCDCFTNVKKMYVCINTFKGWESVFSTSWGAGIQTFPVTAERLAPEQPSRNEVLFCPWVDIACFVMQELLVEDFIAEMLIWNVSTRACIEKHCIIQQQLEEKLVVLSLSLQINRWRLYVGLWFSHLQSRKVVNDSGE